MRPRELAVGAMSRQPALPSAGLWSLLAVASTAAAFWPVLIELVTLWSDTDRPFSHGTLVGPIAVWLTVRACLRAPIAEPAGSWTALVLFVGACFAWLAGLGGDFLAVQEMLFPVLLLLAVASVAGWAMARRLAFPIAYLYLAVPIWSLAVPALQALTVGTVTFAVGLLEIPVFVEGNLIEIPEGVFEISDGCAGLHYFIVAVTIASLYSYLNFRRPLIRVGFVIIAASLAILSNWIRVGSLVLFGHYTNMQHYLITHEHYYYGWVLYAFMLIPTFLIARLLLDFDARHDGSAGAPFPSSEASKGRPRRRPQAFVIGASLALILAALQVPVLRILAEPGPRQPFVIDLPAGEDGWLVASGTEPDWRPRFSDPDAAVLGAYRLGGAQVDVFMVVYRTQSPGRELVGSGNRFSDGGRLVSVDTRSLDGVEVPEEVQRRIVRAEFGTERLIWSWYSVGRRPAATDAEAKLGQLFRGMLGRDSGAAVLVSSLCGADCSAADELLGRYLRSMGPALAAAAVESQGGD